MLRAKVADVFCGCFALVLSVGFCGSLLLKSLAADYFVGRALVEYC